MEEKTISEGSKLEIIEHRKNGRKHTYYSVVSNILDSTTFDVQAPIERGIVTPLEIGKEYECFFITIYGLFRCMAIMEKRYKEAGLNFLRMKMVTQIVKHQRREFFRLEDMLNFRYLNQHTNQWKEATTIDISGSGMRCITNEDLPKGTQVLCELKLDIDKKSYVVTSLAEVIDTISVNLVEKRFETRLVFIDIQTSKQDIIIKYIYDEQRRRIRKESR